MILLVTGVPCDVDIVSNILSKIPAKRVYLALWERDPKEKRMVDKIIERTDGYNVVRLRTNQHNFSQCRLSTLWSNGEQIASQYSQVGQALGEIIKAEGSCSLILRIRVDYEIADFSEPKQICTKKIYVPPIEGHEWVPFEPSLCNDQAWLGQAANLKKIYEDILTDRSEYYLQQSKRNLSLRHPCGADKGIEGVFHQAIRANGLGISFLRMNAVILKYKSRRTKNINNLIDFMFDRFGFFFRSSPTRVSLAYIMLYSVWKFSILKNRTRSGSL